MSMGRQVNILQRVFADLIVIENCLWISGVGSQYIFAEGGIYVLPEGEVSLICLKSIWSCHRILHKGKPNKLCDSPLQSRMLA